MLRSLVGSEMCIRDSLSSRLSLEVNIVATYAPSGGKNMSKRNIKITNLVEKLQALYKQVRTPWHPWKMLTLPNLCFLLTQSKLEPFHADLLLSKIKLDQALAKIISFISLFGTS